MKRLAIVAAIAIGAGVVGALVVALTDQDRLERPVAPAGVESRSVPAFENIASRIGLDGEHVGDPCSANAAGAAWIDLDREGGPELVLGSYKGWTIVWSVTERRAEPISNLGEIKEATGLASADYNNDGWEDLLVASQRGPRLFENQKGKLVEVTASSGLKPHKLGMAGAWGDFNRDGLLDLALTQGNNCVAGPDGSGIHFGRMHLYRQVSPGRFRIADDLLVRPARPALGMAIAWTDLDDDGWLDLYLGNDYLGGVKNQAFRNDSGRQLTPGFPESEIKINSMGIGLGDLNGDLKMDLAISNIQPINTLTNLGQGRFKRTRLAAARPSALQVTWGLVTEDFNNDGREDIWSSAGGIENNRPFPQVFYLNTGSGLLDVADQAGLGKRWRSRSPATIDLNRDGLLDLAVANLNQRPSLYMNRGSRQKGSWVQLALEGDTSKGSPLTPCGARAWLTVAGQTWMRELECSSESFLASSEKILHFGLGERAAQGASLKIRWPDGSISRHTVPLDRRTTIKQ